VDRPTPARLPRRSGASASGGPPAQVLAAMHEAQLFRMYIPKALDGLEIDPITSIIVVEEIARADAAAAWNLMLTYAFLPDACRERDLRRPRRRRCWRLAAERPRPHG
jgi:alkylation response protein AidB-like acyl-CoA dehydrogenase